MITQKKNKEWGSQGEGVANSVWGDYEVQYRHYQIGVFQLDATL